MPIPVSTGPLPPVAKPLENEYRISSSTSSENSYHTFCQYSFHGAYGQREQNFNSLGACLDLIDLILYYPKTLLLSDYFTPLQRTRVLESVRS